MKKHIPPDSIYCHGNDFNICKWWHSLGLLIVHKDIKEAEKIAEKLKAEGKSIYGVEKCDSKRCKYECWSGGSTDCCFYPTRCDFLDKTDIHDDSLLWDMCKECGVNEGDYF